MLSSALVYYETDSNPGFHYYEADGTALNVGSISGSAHARIIQCLKSSKPTNSFHQDMTMFEELTGPPPPGDAERDAPREAPATPDGRLSTIEEESEGESDALYLETWITELMSEKAFVPTTSLDSLYTIPVHTTPDNTVLVTTASDDTQGHLHIGDSTRTQGHLQTRGHPQQYDSDESYHVPLVSTGQGDTYGLDFDEHGYCVELLFTHNVAKTVLTEQQHRLLTDDRVSTMRVYVTAAAKRAVVVKEDDLLTKADVQANPVKVSQALYKELKTWFDNKCFTIQDINKASNIMTSRYVYTWEFVKDDKGVMERTMRLRLVLRGFMDLQAVDVETYSGTARRANQRLLASTAACKKHWVIASLDINMAFLKGLTYREPAEATGEKEREVCFTLPPGSATVLRTLPGFSHYE